MDKTDQRSLEAVLCGKHWLFMQREEMVMCILRLFNHLPNSNAHMQCLFVHLRGVEKGGDMVDKDGWFNIP